jgi:hypothetical protein
MWRKLFEGYIGNSFKLNLFLILEVVRIDKDANEHDKIM